MRFSLRKAVMWAGNPFRQPTGQRTALGPLHPFWYLNIASMLGLRTSSGINVTPEVAQTYSAFYRCTNLVAETIAGCPRTLKLETGRKRRIDADNHPFWGCWTDRPNPTVSGFTFVAMLIRWLIGFGNAFFIVRRDADGRVYEAWPIHPSRVPYELARRHTDGTWTYGILPDPDHAAPAEEKAKPIYLHERDFIHLTGQASDDARWGLGVIEAGKEDIGLGLATNQYASTFFDRALLHSFYLTTDQTLDEKQESQTLRDWENRGGLKNAHRPLILDRGTKIESPTAKMMTAQSAQMIESRQVAVTDVARFIGIPIPFLQLLMNGDKLTAEHFVSLHTYCLLPWMNRLVEGVRQGCMGPRDRTKYRLGIDHRHLMFGNAEQAKQYVKDMVTIGLFSLNEGRDWIGMDSIGPDGDIRVMPANVVKIEYLDAQVREMEATADQAEKVAEAPLPDPNAAPGGDGSGGKPGKAPAPNDNALDPANSPQGDGTETKIGRVKIQDYRHGYLEHAPRMLAHSLETWERSQLASLAGDVEAVGSFPDAAKDFYEGPFTDAVKLALMRVSGKPLVDAKAVSELAASRISALEDLYATPCKDFAGALAFRVAADHPRRVGSLAGLLAASGPVPDAGGQG